LYNNITININDISLLLNLNNLDFFYKDFSDFRNLGINKKYLWYNWKIKDSIRNYYEFLNYANHIMSNHWYNWYEGEVLHYWRFVNYLFNYYELELKSKLYVDYETLGIGKNFDFKLLAQNYYSRSLNTGINYFSIVGRNNLYNFIIKVYWDSLKTIKKEIEAAYPMNKLMNGNFDLLIVKAYFEEKIRIINIGSDKFMNKKIAIYENALIHYRRDYDIESQILCNYKLDELRKEKASLILKNIYGSHIIIKNYNYNMLFFDLLNYSKKDNYFLDMFFEKHLKKNNNSRNKK